GCAPKPARTTGAPDGLPNASRHLIKIRSRSPFLMVLTFRRCFIASTLSGRLASVMLNRRPT
ncbi:hypothetical protein, partial [Escherichia coli]